MPTQRQQRVSRDRRVVSTSTPAYVAPLLPYIVGTVSGNIEIQGRSLSQPPVGPGTPVPLQLDGIPQVYRVSDGTYPSSATLSADHLTVTLVFPGGPIVSDEPLWIGPRDESLRTALGAYLAPGLLTLGASAANIALYTAVLNVDGTVTIAITPGAGVLVGSPLAWSTTGPSGPPSIAAYGPAADQVTLTFALAPVTGSLLTYTGLQIQSGAGISYQPDPSPHVL